MTVSRKLAWRSAWVCAAAAAFAAALWTRSTRELLAAAAARLDLATLLAVVPIQIIASFLCALALWRLRPGPSLLVCLGSRLLRDGGGNLLVFAPGLGEIAGARLLILAGADSAAAVSASALDVLAETLAQIPFAVLALFAVPRLFTLSGLGLPAPQTLILAALLGTGAAFALAKAKGWAAMGTVFARLIDWLSPLREAFSVRRSAVPESFLLHLLAWSSGGFQVFFAVNAMGGHVGLGPAFVIESFVYAVRGGLFIVPAGLGIQEASFVAAGLVFGLPPEQGLAVSLLCRIRDLLLGAPALLAWPALEALAGRRTHDAAARSA